MLISWAGIPCAASNDAAGTLGVFAARSTGLTTDVYQVYFRRDQLLELIVEIDPSRREQLSGGEVDEELIATLRDSAGVSLPSPKALPYRADLVFAEVVSQGDSSETRVTRISDLFFASARPLDGDQSPAMVVVTLVDIRAFWADHGIITRRWNIRLPNGSYALDSVPGGTRSSDRVDEVAPDGAAAVRGIIQDCLDELPGKLRIATFPPLEREDLVEPPTVLAWAASPREVMAGVLEAYGLTPSLDNGSTISFYRRDEGGVFPPADNGRGDNGDELDPLQPSGPAARLIRSNKVASQAPPQRPREVVVAYAPSLFTVAVDHMIPVVPVSEIDPLTGRTQTDWVDATLENLNRLVFGQPESKAGWNLFLRLPVSSTDYTSRLKSNDPAITDEIDQGLNLQGDQGQSLLDGADLGAVDLLKRTLFRYWRIPRHYAQLLPVQDLAESYPSGDRKKPYLQGFRVKAQQVDITQSVLGQRRIAEDEATAATRVLYRAAVERLEQLRQRLDEVRSVSFTELSTALQSSLDAEIEARAASLGGGLSAYADFLVPRLGLPGLIRDLRDSPEIMSESPSALTELLSLPGPRSVPWRIVRGAASRISDGLEVIETLPDGSIRSRRIDASNILDTAGRALRTGLNSLLGLGFTPTTYAQQEQNIRQEIQQQEQIVLDLLSRLDDRQGLRQQLRRLETEFRRQTIENGSEGVLAPIQDQINAVVQQLRDRGPQVEKEQGPFFRILQENMGRSRVESRLIDRELGVFESTEALFWIDDPAVEHLPTARCLPMPVRAVFGTHMRLAAESVAPEVYQPEAEVFNALAGDDLLRARIGQVGDLLPVGGAGLDRAEFRFTAEDVANGDESGTSQTTSAPFRVAVGSERALVELGGFSNLEQLRSRAASRARAVMGFPARGQRAAAGTRESGTLELAGAHGINCNGRVTGVQWRFDGEQITTVVSFQPDTLPIPGVDNPPVVRGQLDVLEFGIPGAWGYVSPPPPPPAAAPAILDLGPSGQSGGGETISPFPRPDSGILSLGPE